MPRLAILIDGDNFSHRLFPKLLSEAEALGEVMLCRAFVNQRDSQRWQEIMTPGAAAQLMLQKRPRPGKSSVDMTLAIDAMDLLHTTAVDGFCIASNDSDFTPLVLRLRQAGVSVYGFGTAAVSRALFLACDKYFNLEEGGSEQPSERGLDARRLALVQDAVLRHANKEGWANVAAVASFLRRKSPSYAENRWGFATVKKALLSTGRYEVQTFGSQTRTKAVSVAHEETACNGNGTPPPDLPIPERSACE